MNVRLVCEDEARMTEIATKFRAVGLIAIPAPVRADGFDINVFSQPTWAKYGADFTLLIDVGESTVWTAIKEALRDRQRVITVGSRPLGEQLDPENWPRHCIDIEAAIDLILHERRSIDESRKAWSVEVAQVSAAYERGHKAGEEWERTRAAREKAWKDSDRNLPPIERTVGDTLSELIPNFPQYSDLGSAYGATVVGRGGTDPMGVIKGVIDTRVGTRVISPPPTEEPTPVDQVPENSVGDADDDTLFGDCPPPSFEEARPYDFTSVVAGVIVKFGTDRVERIPYDATEQIVIQIDDTRIIVSKGDEEVITSIWYRDQLKTSWSDTDDGTINRLDALQLGMLMQRDP